MGSLWKFKGREVRRLHAVSAPQEAALREARERIEHPKACSRGVAIRINEELPPAKKAVFIQKVFAAVGTATNCIHPTSGAFTDQFLCVMRDGSKEPGIVQHGLFAEDEIAKQKLTLAMRYLELPQLKSAEYNGLTMLFFCFHEDLADMELALLRTRIRIIALQEDIVIDSEELNFEGMRPGEHITLEESPAAKMAREEQEAARELAEAKQLITILKPSTDCLFINIDPNTPNDVAQKFVMTVSREAGRITESITENGQATPRWFALYSKEFTHCSISCFNQGLSDKEARLLQIRARMIAARHGINITKMEFVKGPEGEGTGMMIVGQIELMGKPIIVKIRLGFPSDGSDVPVDFMSFGANPKFLLAVIRDEMAKSIAAGDLEIADHIHFPALKFDPNVNTDGVEVLSIDLVNDRREEQVFVTFQTIDDPRAKA